ncbi:hypothetical protein FACS1894156_5080 [Bacteroidia bacterium]|nr:hypothetical protein FACS1894156_5080 [Bacteroidia bacterium]
MQKTKFFTTAILAGMLMTACCEKHELPAILKEHKAKATFTKLNKGCAQLVPLFNGKDLAGWYTYTPAYGKNNDVEQAFTVADGALHFAGESMGYLCTNDSYSNYYLKVVFRWGEKKYADRKERPRDSGVLYHLADSVKDALWPTTVECQIQENDCGDYYSVGGSSFDSPNLRPEGEPWRVVRTANFERPNTEWNTIEVICLDNTSEHYVNGHLVNEATNLSVAEGKILLQLEGAEIFYKSVELLPLK